MAAGSERTVVERVPEACRHLEAVIIAVELRWLALLPLALGHVRNCALAQPRLTHEKASDDSENVRVAVQRIEERVRVVRVRKVGLVPLGWRRVARGRGDKFRWIGVHPLLLDELAHGGGVRLGHRATEHEEPSQIEEEFSAGTQSPLAQRCTQSTTERGYKGTHSVSVSREVAAGRLLTLSACQSAGGAAALGAAAPMPGEFLPAAASPGRCGSAGRCCSACSTAAALPAILRAADCTLKCTTTRPKAAARTLGRLSGALRRRPVAPVAQRLNVLTEHSLPTSLAHIIRH